MAKRIFHKIKRRVRLTILFYVEGSSEEVFLKYLRRIYAQGSGVAVKIKNGQGGSADGIVKRACSCPGAYDKRAAVLDNDKSKAEMEEARRLAEKCNVDLIENEPCLEALLLRILDVKKLPENKKSKYYKKEFEKEHICENKRCDIDEYAKIFPKKVLDSRRKEIGELDRMIGFMEKGR